MMPLKIMTTDTRRRFVISRLDHKILVCVEFKPNRITVRFAPEFADPVLWIGEKVEGDSIIRKLSLMGEKAFHFEYTHRLPGETDQEAR